MKLRDMQRRIVSMGWYTSSEIDQRFRSLTAENQVSTGPRGPNAPHLEPEDIALALLCLVARRSANAFDVMKRATFLRMIPRPEYNFVHEWTLGPLLALNFKKSENDGVDHYHETIIDRLEVAVEGDAAWVDINIGGAKAKLLFTNDDEQRQKIQDDICDYEISGSVFMGHRFVLTKNAIDQLKAIDLTGERTQNASCLQ